ncbi:G-type lectin S-receptor-like serine/threonine-protein kinase At2g19130 [Phoenix dactylifera]|uniref:Receptor-like serine/threonine-protein kinase n=1 Tax=Phoenix dactylifera TaxID=42345 RepID=A0A8B9ACY3_PHODC|nr:G-type lectin S-receptor-like serine/threonine-protein kinase At2g19130 [Phoenix dactylifera]
MAAEIRPCSSLSFLLFFLFSSLNIQRCVATDSISSGQALSGNQTIVSKERNFELGFFTPGNSHNYYIGIWYKKISKQTVIWVANRETPVSSPSSSELKISEDGNLVLINQFKHPIWSSNSTPKTKNSTVAVLLETGNLVLKDLDHPSAVIWQSFDHPTDTLMPGGWIGVNKITGEVQSLIPWKNFKDPAPGPYVDRVDPSESGQFVLQWNGSQTYWRSGKWNGRSFPSIPEMSLNSIYNYSYIGDSSRQEFTLTVSDGSIITRLVMNVYGQKTQWTWFEDSEEWILHWSVPRDQCDVYSLCGAFSVCDMNSLQHCKCLQGFKPASSRNWDLNVWSDGCVRRTRLQCSNMSSTEEERDGFLMIPDMKLPDNSDTLPAKSAKQCELACLNNCSCTAYAFGSGCLIWNGDLWDLKHLSDNDTEAVDLYIRLAASDLPFSSNKRNSVLVIILVAVGGSIIILCIIFVQVWRCHRRRLARKMTVVDGSLVLFDYNYLLHCTKKFSEKLGEGSFGQVFKGALPDSNVIAVKKLIGIRQGEKEFWTEVRTLGTIQHINLVRLRGFCMKGIERLLVYDYMPNGSLDYHLFQSNSEVLDWKTRFQITLGVARGLAYLHEKCRECIIHCDVKPENILLDVDFSPKVADFGMAKLIGRDFSRALTTTRGTLGYLAPEWISGLAITQKADVYSYGMMLFEVISGMRNREPVKNGSVGNFPLWAAMKIDEGEILALLDERLEGDADIEELSRACRVACWCIQNNEVHRPAMGQVVQILEGVLEVNVPPIPWHLQLLGDDQVPDSTEYSTS